MFRATAFVVLLCVVFLVTSQPAPTASRLVQFSMLEQMPVGSFVGDVIRDANLTDRYLTPDLQRIRFQIRSASSKFAIDERSGVIRNTHELDREQLCPDNSISTCSVTFDVSLRPAQFFQIFKVSVHLIDINDNSPVFEQEQVIIRISETTPPGTLFVLPAADDADAGAFGVRGYQLLSQGNGSLPFSLQATKQSDDVIDVKLHLAGNLDRETQDSFLLTLVAFDGGSPARSAQLSVNVVVLDSNDNYPVFDQNAYSVEVREDTLPGTSLIQVQARDSDEGANAMVTYTFPEHVERSYGHVFRIDEHTGIVYLRSPVDYERARAYQLTVAANDNGSPPSLPVFAKLTVSLIDVNDNRPSIAVNILTDSGTAEVRENIDQAGTFVAHVAARDADSGDNGKVECQLEDDANTETPLFQLEPLFDPTTRIAGASMEYKIVSTTSFDREERSEYQLLVTCRDDGEPASLMTSREIRVDILDENDNSPRLDSESHWITVPENIRVGAQVFRVNASDADAGPNAELIFQMRPQSGATVAQDNLTIDRTSGEVTALVSFDYESGPRDLVYVVTVSDRGDPQRSATATLRVSVTDVNDNKPHFERSSYFLSTAENHPSGTSVGQLVATDGDHSKQFTRVFYDILRLASTDGDSFTIDKNTAVIRNAKRLDRELQAVYHFTVTASNYVTTTVTSRSGHDDVVDFADVTVFIDDVNDNRPVFVFPGPSKGRTVELPPRYMIGSLVTRLEATDDDTGLNAELQYSIISSHNSDQLFDIDPVTGVIVVGSRLHPDTLASAQQIRLAVLVTDKGTPPMQTIADLFVSVTPNDTLSVETARLGTPGDGEASGSLSTTAITAAIGAAAGGTLVIICVVVVALTMCITKRRQRRKQRHLELEKREFRGECLDAASSLGGASSSFCQHRYRASGSSVKPGSPSCYVREPGPGDDGSITTYQYVPSTGQRDDSVRSSLSSINVTSQRRSNSCQCSVVDDVIQRSPSVMKCRLEHHTTTDSGFALESPDTDRASSTGTDQPYLPDNQQVATNNEELRPAGQCRHHRHHHGLSSRYHHHHRQQSQHSQTQYQPLSSSSVKRKYLNDKRYYSAIPGATQADDMMTSSRTSSSLGVAMLSRDTESTCSCSCSCADSGRGPSEDDDNYRRCRLEPFIANSVVGYSESGLTDRLPAFDN